jgi:phosphate starvation-inducible membrane PsiE
VGLWACFFTVLSGWHGSNRPMTALQAVSSSVEAVLDALFVYFSYFFIKKMIIFYLLSSYLIYFIYSQVPGKQQMQKKHLGTFGPLSIRL